MFSYLRFSVLIIISRNVIYFRTNFCVGCEVTVEVYFFPYGYPVGLEPFVEKIILSPSIILAPYRV